MMFHCPSLLLDGADINNTGREDTREVLLPCFIDYFCLNWINIDKSDVKFHRVKIWKHVRSPRHLRDVDFYFYYFFGQYISFTLSKYFTGLRHILFFLCPIIKSNCHCSDFAPTSHNLDDTFSKDPA